MVGTKGGFALILVMTIIMDEHLLAVVDLRAAPGAATIFPKHPHVEGCITIVLEMEGAPPAQAAHVGERMPTTGQSYVARGGDLNHNPRSSAAATVCLQAEPTWTGDSSSAKKRES